ncbi:MAG: TonB-dependent receptor [Planctomycetota bacterium]
MRSSLLALVLVSLATAAGGSPHDDRDLTELSLEELLEVEVTTVSRKSSSVAGSPAAVYVITREDIRRSGHTSLPELLRLVPGLHVARVSSSSWAIAARGENGRFADKLLVMIDGRSIYTNLFSGVFWDAHDLPLEDIERIEVIRGPGGTIWGANAVNGVINVITRHTADTTGTYAHALVGDEDRGIASYRYGGRLGESTTWRGFAKWLERDATLSPEGDTSPDPWSYFRTGARFDWNAGETDSFLVEGDLYRGQERERDRLLSPIPPYDRTFEGTFHNDGGFVLGRWSRTVSAHEDLQLQAFVDAMHRESAPLDIEQWTVDLDFQHRLGGDRRHEVIWGLGCRWWASDLQGTPSLEFVPAERDDHLFSGFVQDEIRLRGEELRLIVGTKLEHNDYTGFELQPNVRGIWQPSEDRAVWAAVSRAVRTPSVANDGFSYILDVIPGTPTTVVKLLGSRDFRSEDLLAYEIGCRWRPRRDLSFDLAAFYHDYDDLDSGEPGAPFFDGTYMIVPVYFANLRNAQSLGLELATTFAATENWRLFASLTGIDFRESFDEGSADQNTVDGESATPDYILHTRSYWNLAEDLDLDCGIYAVDGLRALGVRNYWRGDVRLAWRPTPRLEASLVLQNAWDPAHREFTSELDSALSEIERSAYVQMSWWR